MLPGAFIGQDSECVVYSSFCSGESDSMFAGPNLQVALQRSDLRNFNCGCLKILKYNRNH